MVALSGKDQRGRHSFTTFMVKLELASSGDAPAEVTWESLLPV
jgi:hypothetical protein